MDRSTTNRHLRSLAAIAALSLVGAACAQVQYSVTELQPLPGTGWSNGFGINDLGDAVGESDSSSSFSAMATLWRAGGAPVALGRVPRGNYSTAWAINNAGVIAGDADDGDFRPNTVVFRNGVATFIDSGANNSHPKVVLNNGQIIGDYLKGFGGNAWNPTIWTLDKPDRYKHVFLPQFVDPTGGPSNVFANGGNNLGVVVGQVSSTLWSSRAGLWKNDSKHTLTLLDPLPGQWDSYALAINDNGVVAGVSDAGSALTVPVVWAPNSTTPTALESVPGESICWVQDINNLNQVIGYHGPNATPAIWINGQLINPQDCLDASGAGWTIGTLYDINNRGQIVGIGLHNGQNRAFILTPVSSSP